MPEPIVVDEKTFALVAELEVRKALRLQYPVSVMSIKGSLGTGGDTLPDDQLAEQLLRIVSRLIRATDLIHVRSNSPTLHLLLAGALFTDLGTITRRITDEAGYHRVLIRGQPRAIEVRIGTSCFPTTAASSPDLLSQAGAAVENGG